MAVCSLRVLQAGEVHLSPLRAAVRHLNSVENPCCDWQKQAPWLSRSVGEIQRGLSCLLPGCSCLWRVALPGLSRWSWPCVQAGMAGAGMGKVELAALPQEWTELCGHVGVGAGGRGRRSAAAGRLYNCYSQSD